MPKKGYKQTKNHIKKRALAERIAYKEGRHRGGFKKGHKILGFLGKKHTEKYKQLRSENNPMKNLIIIKKRIQTVVKKGIFKLENHPNWRGGISFEPYSNEFNNNLKETIKNRDKYTCQLCKISEKDYKTKSKKKYRLNIHHIDYNKKNNSLSNFITLCLNCHTKTEFNRDSWEDYFRNLLKEKNL